MHKIKSICMVSLTGAALLLSACQTVTAPDTERIVDGVEIVNSSSNLPQTKLHGDLANCVFPNESCATVPNDAKGRLACTSKGGVLKPHQKCHKKVIIKYTEPEVIYR